MIRLHVLPQTPIRLSVKPPASVRLHVKSAGYVSGWQPPQELPIATETVLGGIKVGENLKITADGVLSVDVATAVEQDNTKPITSAAVHTEVGNIEVLLAAL